VSVPTTTTAPIASAPLSASRPRRLLGLLGEVTSRPNGLVGAIIVGGLVIVALFARWLAPTSATKQDIASRLQGSSSSHLLGTDELGRDLLSRLMYGSRIALGVSLASVAVALLIGLVLGIVAGYAGGLIDNALVVVMDTLQAFPAVILALAILALLGGSLRNVIIVIAVAFIPNYARVTRALVLAAKENQWVEAERSLGARLPRLLVIHVLPNIMAPLFILMAMDIPGAIATEAGLSFLGLGVQPPTPSWGVLLADGFQNVSQSPWGIIWASLALMITTFGFTMLGETLRDIVDPKLSGVRRWQR
jgi:peptide/nickel transport system permease protein